MATRWGDPSRALDNAHNDILVTGAWRRVTIQGNTCYSVEANRPFASIIVDADVVGASVVGNAMLGARSLFASMRGRDIFFGGDNLPSCRGRDILVPATSTFIDVSLPHIELSSYTVKVSPQWDTTYWISNKTATGFRINFGTAPTVDSYLDWEATGR